MIYLRVLLSYTTASDHKVEETTGHVLTNLYGNANYPNPPVDTKTLQAGLTTFTDAIAAQKQGGTAATAAKNQARVALIALLRQLAMYVQTTVQANPAFGLAELLGSGFDAASTSRARHPLATPTIIKISNTGAAQLTLRAKGSANARTYEAQYQIIDKDGPGEWIDAGLFSSTRGMTITGLTPGTLYSFQVRAVGGSLGYSQWSDAVSHRSL